MKALVFSSQDGKKRHFFTVGDSTFLSAMPNPEIQGKTAVVICQCGERILYEDQVDQSPEQIIDALTAIMS